MAIVDFNAAQDFAEPVPTKAELARLMRIRAQLFQTSQKFRGTEDAKRAERIYKQIDEKIGPHIFHDAQPDIESPVDTGIRHFADSATFGGAGALSRGLIRRAIPGADKPVGRGPSVMGKMAADREASDAENSGAAITGEVIGAALPGTGPARAFGLAGKAVKGIKALEAGSDASRAARMLLGGVKGAVTNAAGAALTGGARGFVDKDSNLRDRFRAAGAGAVNEATSPANLAIGATLGTIAGGAESIGHGNSQTSKDIRTVEDFGNGAKVSPARGGARGGVYEEPLLKDMSTDADRGVIAEKAQKSLRGKLNDIHTENSKGFEAAKEEARQSGALARNVNPFKLYNEAVAAHKSMSTTAPGRGRIEAEIITPLQDYINKGAGMKIEDWHDFSSKLKRLARLKTNTDADANSIQFGDLAQSAQKELENTPYFDMISKYRDVKDKLRLAYMTLGFRDPPISTDLNDPVAADKVANFLLRQGKDTETGGKSIQRLEDASQIESDFPQLSPELHANELMGAKQRLKFGAPGGGLHRNVMGYLGHNVEPSLAATYLLGRHAPKLGLPLTTMTDESVKQMDADEARAAAAEEAAQAEIAAKAARTKGTP